MAAVLGDIVNYCNYGYGTGPTGSAGSTGTYYGVTMWTGPRGWSPGSLVRQNAVPAVGSERIFVALTGGTGVTGTEPTWTTTRGATTSELNGSTMIWQECTGLAALNGDITNTPTWQQLKTAGTPTQGMLIQRNNGASLQICQTAGAISASEPSFSNTAGVRTVDNSTVWISLGAPSNYTQWGAPHARLVNALANNWAPAGYVPGTGTTGIATAVNAANNGVCYIGKIHNEGQSTAMTITSVVGAAANQSCVQKVICADSTLSTPPVAVATGAVVGTTGATLQLTFSDGGVYFYGITFSGGSAINHIMRAYGIFDNCVMACPQTSGAATFALNAANAGATIWNNTQLYVGHTGTYIDTGNSLFVWQNTASALAPGSVVPRALIGHSTLGHLNNVVIEGVGLDGLVGPVVINNEPVQEQQGYWLVKDCKMAAAQGTTGVTGPIGTNQTIQIINSDSTATTYKSARYQFEGNETTETAITRVGGAVDLGGQAQSRKIVTGANLQWVRPFKCEPMTIYNNKTGQNVTVTIYGTWNVSNVPNNDDIWIEVEYLGTSGSPLGVFATSTKSSFLAAFAALTADGSTWNGGGSGAGWSPFSMSVALNGGTYPQPQLAGLIQVRPRVARFASTFYIDPKIVLT